MSYCAYCRNTGQVTVWHPLAIVWHRWSVHKQRPTDYERRGQEPKFNKATCAVPCSCIHGEKHSIWHRRDGTTRKLKRFGDVWWHAQVKIYDRGLSSTKSIYDIETDTAGLDYTQWLADKHRVPEFDEWNEG